MSSSSLNFTYKYVTKSANENLPTPSWWTALCAMRHQVYAVELKQYPQNTQRTIEDPGIHFIICMENDVLKGYVSITPPPLSNCRFMKFVDAEILKSTLQSQISLDDTRNAYEFRSLTVDISARGCGIAEQLVQHAIMYVANAGGTDIIAMGHHAVLPLYRRIGMHIFDPIITIGESEYRLMYISAQIAQQKLQEYFVSKNHKSISATPSFASPSSSSSSSVSLACIHGGDSWAVSGFDFDKRRSMVIGDVLDSSFQPCPEVLDVLRSQLTHCCMESPPIHSEPLIEKISNCRRVDSSHLMVSSGSSSLMYTCFPRLLHQDSSVLLLSPTYGEYKHIMTNVIRCKVTEFFVYPETHFQIDVAELCRVACNHDALILVNPNSPTGIYCDQMEHVVKRLHSDRKANRSRCKCIWVDETYIDYVQGAVSLESVVSSVPELIVCKSMSKVYALSGLRIAYIASQQANHLRPYVPPWSVSLPAQLAGIEALSHPSYYKQQYEIIHERRLILEKALHAMNMIVFSGCANFVLAFLPETCSMDASQFVDRCRENHVYVRDVTDMGSTLGKCAIRFAVRPSPELLQMLDTVANILGVGKIHYTNTCI